MVEITGLEQKRCWDAGEFPPPKRVGRARRGDGRPRACRSFWHRADVELFARCQSMADFHRLRQQPGEP